MGMYTQIRGWLNVDSIGDYEGNNYREIYNKLTQAQENFQDDLTIKVDRRWVCNDTVLHKGGNGSVYIFFGTELKNYDSAAESWIKYLLNYFPNAEGRIDFQYEEDEYYCFYWLISGGKIIKDDRTEKWCEGYGNMYK
jgi:hypothetical protein